MSAHCIVLMLMVGSICFVGGIATVLAWAAKGRRMKEEENR